MPDWERQQERFAPEPAPRSRRAKLRLLDTANITDCGILFTLNGVLVHYYHAAEYGELLGQGVRCVRGALEARPLPGTLLAAKRVAEENREESDNRVCTLQSRLCNIFDLDEQAEPPALLAGLCDRFLRPFFERARLYDDTLPRLQELHDLGYHLGVVANAIWGSDGGLWRDHLDRLGLLGLLDACVFCSDVGWRKPSPEPFRAAVGQMHVNPRHCLMVGSDAAEDVAPARREGMRAVLMDRWDTENAADVRDLDELTHWLENA